ncbi:MAG: hypothetical protein ACOX5G_13075 [Kiritimatiellia bacterium]
MAIVATAATAETSDLRGFGRTEVKRRILAPDKEGFGDGQHPSPVTVLDFACETPEKAETVAGKFLLDLYADPGVVFEGGIHATSGGAAFAVERDGARTAIYAAESRAALEAVLPPGGSLVASAAVPEYMKAFRWGTYGMGGLENFHNWMEKAKTNVGIDPKTDRKCLDPREDFAFLRDMGPLHFDNWLELQGFDNSDGIVAPGVWSRRKLAGDFGVPIGYRLYMPDGSWGWAARRFAARMEKPAPWIESGWHGVHEHRPHFSWNDPDIYGYVAARTKDAMLAVKTPGARSWMHPVGELVHCPWYDWHSDYSAVATNSWHDYLRGKGVTLEETAAMFNRPDRPFAFWDEVPVPEFAHFAGLPGLVLDLAGAWRTAAMDETEWVDLPDFPGNWDFLWLYLKKGEIADSRYRDGRQAWQRDIKRRFRRVFEWSGALADGDRVWLYFFPMNMGALRHAVSLNGGEPVEVGAWCALDVTEKLAEGSNVLDIVLQGTVWDGRVFLSTEKPAVYPNMSEARCRLWTLWHSWRRDTKAARCEQVFDAMRQADPDAPVEFMAPLHFGQRLTNRLMRDWGAFAHFTGEGVWFFPWYKRYGKLYGYQGTSEQAGPCDTVAKARTSALRVFLAGLDMHKPVFLTQTYSRTPEVRAWWLEHKDLFARMGTYDIDLKQPQVLIYRRTDLTGDAFPTPFPAIDETIRDVRSPWDYDIGRGELQSIGQSPLYLDDDGIEDGKMEGFKVLFDCGNEIIPEAAVARIQAWVESGGVFVAYPFTGQSTPLKADAWPMAALSGSKIKEPACRRGYVPKVVFPDNSTLFPSFAGQTIHGATRRMHENDFALEIVADGAEPVLTWEDGRIAATARRVGKGMVVHLGSMFWRGSEDVKGMWNPSDEVERVFLRDLLAAAGHPPALVETDDRLVLAQPYRSHNGLDLVAVLCNFNETNATNNAEAGNDPRMDVTIALRTGARPRRFVAYGGDGVTEPAFTFADGVATATIPLPMQEVKIVEAECYAPGDALDHWWAESQEQWHEIKKPSHDFSMYAEGEWRDPTQDLKDGWEVGPLAAAEEEEGDASHPPGGLRDVPLDAFQFWGWPAGRGATAVKRFDLSVPEWLEAGGEILLVCGAWVGPCFNTPATIRLNGETLATATAASYLDIDVTARLKATGNVLEVDFTDGDAFTGMNGSIHLYHRPRPTESIDLLSGGHVRSAEEGRDFIEFEVPRAWASGVRVRLYMEGAREVPKGVRVGNRFVRKHHHNFGNITDIDITGILRFGETNRIDLGANSPGEHSDRTSAQRLAVLRFDLYR